MIGLPASVERHAGPLQVRDLAVLGAVLLGDVARQVGKLLPSADFLDCLERVLGLLDLVVLRNLFGRDGEEGEEGRGREGESEEEEVEKEEEEEEE
jgi:hypothetical protein